MKKDQKTLKESEWIATIYCGKETVKINGFPDFRSFVNKTRADAKQELISQIIKELPEEWTEIGYEASLKNDMMRLRAGISDGYNAYRREVIKLLKSKLPTF